MRRPPRLARIGAPVASLMGALCLYFALDVGPPRPIQGPGHTIEPNTSLFGQQIATVRSEHPSMYGVGLLFLAVSAVLWAWDAWTSP